MKNIKVYTINNCGYCEAAKALLKSLKLDFFETNISHDEKARLDLVQKTGHRTMPQIFIDDQFVGGYQELKEHLKKDP
jgi:glutaredoxin